MTKNSPDRDFGIGGQETVLRAVRLSAIICLAFAALALPVGAQETGQVGPQVIIEVVEPGIGYNERGELLLVTALTNAGDTASTPLDVTAVVLNDCIIPSVLQTCRFAAFGVFHNVAPDGIEAGGTLQWVFNFGVYPELDLSRWSVLWYQTPAASAANQTES